MSFERERRMVQRVFDTGDPDLPMPPVASRIKTARAAAGLATTDVAQHLEMGIDAYCDLEFHDDELLCVADLRIIPALAAMLRVPVLTLLFGSQPQVSIPPVAPSDVAAAIRAKLTADAVTLDEFSEQVGWDLDGLLDDPASIWTGFPALGTSEVCTAVGLDWVGLLV